MALTPTQLAANTILASPSGTTGPLGVRPIAAADVAATGHGASLSGYATGTASNLTATAAVLGLGTGSPAITIATAGTYLLMACANLSLNAATFAANRTATLKIRRTNNTAADLANASRTINTGVTSLITGQLSQVSVPAVVYTASAGDILQVWGSVSVVPTAGNLQCDSAEIIAIRIG